MSKMRKIFPLNILFVADVSVAKIIGGAERVLYEQSNRLCDRGHNVHILTRKLPNHESESKIINGVKEWRYDCISNNPAIFFKKTLTNTKILFEDLCQKYHFDCINFHQPFTALGINQSKFSKRIPKIYTCHSLSFEEFISRKIEGYGSIIKIFSLLQILIRKKIEKNALLNSNMIMVLSKFTKNKLANIYNVPVEKIKVIPGGVDITKFNTLDSKKLIREQLNISNNKTILFTVRNLVQRMGIENLLVAFKKVEEKVSDVELVIGGKGPLERQLVSFAKKLGIDNKVHFLGFISEEQLPQYYQMADIFVLPTKELEGFGLVTLESMACGLPVIGTPVGGTKEIIENFDKSFLFKGTDSDSIAKLILEKYYFKKQNPKRWHEISDRCRRFVEQNYTWKKNLDSFVELIVKTSYSQDKSST